MPERRTDISRGSASTSSSEQAQIWSTAARASRSNAPALREPRRKPGWKCGADRLQHLPLKRALDVVSAQYNPRSGGLECLHIPGERERFDDRHVRTELHDQRLELADDDVRHVAAIWMTARLAQPTKRRRRDTPRIGHGAIGRSAPDLDSGWGLPPRPRLEAEDGDAGEPRQTADRLQGTQITPARRRQRQRVASTSTRRSSSRGRAIAAKPTARSTHPWR